MIGPFLLLLACADPISSTCAVALDGADDYVDALHVAAFDPVQHMSLGVTFNPNASAPGKIFASMWDQVGMQRQWIADSDGGGQGFKFSICTNSTTCTSYCISRAMSWPLKETTDVFFTYNGEALPSERCKIYIRGADATVSTTGIIPASIFPSTAKFTVGSRTNGENTRDWNGTIDEVLYSATTTFTATTISAISTRRSGVPVSPPAGTTLRWRMGEDNGCTGSIVKDPVSNLQGTLRGNAHFVPLIPSVGKDPPSTAICASQNLKRQCFAILGQSNGSGRGTGQPFIPLYPANLWNFSNVGAWVQAPIEPLDGPLDTYPVLADAAGNDLGLALMDRVAEFYPTHEIGLVHADKGGTNILTWLPGANGTAFLYGAAQARLLAAQGSCELAGIVYYQGEDDAKDAYSASQWRVRFEFLRYAIRRDQAKTRVPFFVVRLPPTSPGSTWPAWQQVRDAQASVADQDTFVIDAPDAPRVASAPVHLETAALNTLGYAIADRWRSTCYAQSLTP